MINKLLSVRARKNEQKKLLHMLRSCLTILGMVHTVVKSGFSLNPYSRVFFNEAIEEVVQH